MTRNTIASAVGCLSLVGLAACDVAYPVAVIGENGAVFRGTASDTFLEGGSFQVTNGASFCTGTYRKYEDISTVSFPVTCSNGLRGIGTAYFDSFTQGSGFVTMSDGSRWQFLFGSGATRI